MRVADERVAEQLMADALAGDLDYSDAPRVYAILRDLLDDRRDMVEWIAENAPEMHVARGFPASRVLHRGPFNECDNEPCAAARQLLEEGKPE